MRAYEFYGRLLLVALTLIFVPWMMFVWEASTGTTSAGRRTLGQNSSPQHLEDTRKRAIGITLILGPVAAWCVLARRTKQ